MGSVPSTFAPGRSRGTATRVRKSRADIGGMISVCAPPSRAVMAFWFCIACRIIGSSAQVQPQPGNSSMASRPSGLAARKASLTRSSGFPGRCAKRTSPSKVQSVGMRTESAGIGFSNP